ncbi:hypothetical protein ACIOZM_15885 [Pseudomonas sp. NPDC087346]|uniref:hypothetical protein n=1 Tax=Pseudomonas sp. NPDC087346 TaxID=3364438 RepID=UPI0037F4B1F3
MKTLRAIHQHHLFLTWTPLVLTALAALLFHEFVIHAILTNVILNGIIIGTAIGGALLMLLRIRAIRREWQVFEQFALLDPEPDSPAERLQQDSVASRLLTNLGRIRRTNVASAIEQSHIQEELEDVHRVLDSRQEAAQYVVGLMIALGLLGTFIGLLETLVAVGNLIGGFSSADPNQDVEKALTELIGNLKFPLTAMGTAFSASMFGLLCSLMLGIMMLSVRAFQVEFLQFARSVVDEITAHTHAPDSNLMQGTETIDEALWTHRIADLQQMQERLHGQVREIAMQGKRNEERQGVLLSCVESLVSFAWKADDKVQALESHLAVLPALLQSTKEAHYSTEQLIETVMQLLRQSEQQHQGLARSLIYQMGEFATQVDQTHAEQARRTHTTLVEVLDQRLATAEAQTIQANEVQRSEVHHHEMLERVFNAFGEANAATHTQMQRLHHDSLEQTQLLQAMIKTVASAITQAQVQTEKLNEWVLVQRNDATGTEIAYEVAQGTERLERELRVGMAAMISVLRNLKNDANCDNPEEAL